MNSNPRKIPESHKSTKDEVIRGLTLGREAFVVGTWISSPDGLSDNPADIKSDLVELRIDQMGVETGWQSCARQLEACGIPVIITPRHVSEGGKWDRPEAERLRIYESALKCASLVDVEFKSSIAEAVCRAAKIEKKLCILSFHDFAKTPPLAELEAVVSEAGSLASIVKITTMVQGKEDIETLETLLKHRLQVPLCVMGMGGLGSETRFRFPKLGSCLTYGWLDQANAPGQLSARELVRRLREE
jgi:3-dehydroquinate dehydratase type I